MISISSVLKHNHCQYSITMCRNAVRSVDYRSKVHCNVGLRTVQPQYMHIREIRSHTVTKFATFVHVVCDMYKSL